MRYSINVRGEVEDQGILSIRYFYIYKEEYITGINDSWIESEERTFSKQSGKEPKFSEYCPIWFLMFTITIE